MKEKKNKLSIYLIKNSISVDDIVIKDSGLKIIEVSGARLYIKPAVIKSPKWILNFFGSILDEQKEKIFSSMPSVAFVIPVRVDKNTIRYFVITFGAGHHLMQKGVFEERFGLRIVLNAVDEKNIRSIDKKNLGALIKQTREQAGRNAETSEFGINIEQDLIQAVSGLSIDLSLGKTIFGKDSLHISVSNTFSNISNLLKKCFQYSNSKAYKKKFPWIDQIEEIRDIAQIGKLDAILISKINSENIDKIWMAIPEIIDWADFDCFKYKRSDKAVEYSDLLISDFIKEHERYKGKFTLEVLKRYEAYCYFESSPYKSWRIYDCLYAEISERDRIYTLTNGRWYQVNIAFSKAVEREYLKILSQSPPTSLPNCPIRKEKPTEPVVESRYNEYAAKKLDCALLDGKNVMYNGYPIEVCDLYTKSKEFIHVKHYGGSSVLSHLFNQGVVSAELFSSDPVYRLEMNKKLFTDFQIKNPNKQIIPQQYKVIFGIISRVKGKLDIPFFSKVSLKNAYRRLRLYGHSVYLQKIDIDKNIRFGSSKK